MEVDSPSPPIDPSLLESAPETPAPQPASSAAQSSSLYSSADPDPVVASYDVFTNPSLPPDRQLLIMQHPNQRQPSAEAYTHLSEVRIKPRNGMIEVDVPLSYHLSDYDRDKGLRWGTALARSMAAKNGGSHGLAGGFGVGAPAMRGGGAARKRNPDEVDLDLLDTRDWSEAVRQDRVLRTQTLGGNFPVEAESNCRWMVGIFQGKQLHLTPATALIHLRPQLHHIDATAEQERLARPREGGAGGGAAGGPSSSSGTGAAGAGKDGAGAATPHQPAARAITMTIKSASGNEVTTETMTDRLRFAQQEPWSKLKYEDDTSNRAWDMFSQNLVYKGPGAAGEEEEGDKPSISTNKIKTHDQSKGKNKASEAMDVDDDDKDKDDSAGAAAAPPLPPQLKGKWVSSDFLKAVSGMQEGEGAEADRLLENDGVVEVKKEERSTTTAVARPKGATSSAVASGKKAAGGKGKSVAFE